MNSFVEKYLNWSYLSGISNSVWFQKYLLYIAVVVIILPVLLKIFLRLKKRSAAYKKFDRIWFWGFISFGLVGLFLWFSVNQGLPTMGARITVYLWLLSIGIYKVCLLVYYRMVTCKEVVRYHEKKRKEKYLK